MNLVLKSYDVGSVVIRLGLSSLQGVQGYVWVVEGISDANVIPRRRIFVDKAQAERYYAENLTEVKKFEAHLGKPVS